MDFNKPLPSSTILFIDDTTDNLLNSKKTLLMLTLLSREYAIDLLPRVKHKFLVGEIQNSNPKSFT